MSEVNNQYKEIIADNKISETEFNNFIKTKFQRLNEQSKQKLKDTYQNLKETFDKEGNQIKEITKTELDFLKALFLPENKEEVANLKGLSEYFNIKDKNKLEEIAGQLLKIGLKPSVLLKGYKDYIEKNLNGIKKLKNGNSILDKVRTSIGIKFSNLEVNSDKLFENNEGGLEKGEPIENGKWIINDEIKSKLGFIDNKLLPSLAFYSKNISTILKIKDSSDSGTKAHYIYQMAGNQLYHLTDKLEEIEEVLNAPLDDEGNFDEGFFSTQNILNTNDGMDKRLLEGIPKTDGIELLSEEDKKIESESMMKMMALIVAFSGTAIATGPIGGLADAGYNAFDFFTKEDLAISMLKKLPQPYGIPKNFHMKATFLDKLGAGIGMIPLTGPALKTIKIGKLAAKYGIKEARIWDFVEILKKELLSTYSGTKKTTAEFENKIIKSTKNKKARFGKAGSEAKKIIEKNAKLSDTKKSEKTESLLNGEDRRKNIDFREIRKGKIIDIDDIKADIKIEKDGDYISYSIGEQEIGHIQYSVETSSIYEFGVKFSPALGTSKGRIKGLGKYMLETFISQTKRENIIINGILDNSENFYKKSLNELKNKGIIKSYEIKDGNIHIIKIGEKSDIMKKNSLKFEYKYKLNGNEEKLIIEHEKELLEIEKGINDDMRKYRRFIELNKKYGGKNGIYNYQIAPGKGYKERKMEYDKNVEEYKKLGNFYGLENKINNYLYNYFGYLPTPNIFEKESDKIPENIRNILDELGFDGNKYEIDGWKVALPERLYSDIDVNSKGVEAFLDSKFIHVTNEKLFSDIYESGGLKSGSLLMKNENSVYYGAGGVSVQEKQVFFSRNDFINYGSLSPNRGSVSQLDYFDSMKLENKLFFVSSFRKFANEGYGINLATNTEFEDPTLGYSIITRNNKGTKVDIKDLYCFVPGKHYKQKVSELKKIGYDDEFINEYIVEIPDGVIKKQVEIVSNSKFDVTYGKGREEYVKIQTINHKNINDFIKSYFSEHIRPKIEKKPLIVIGNSDEKRHVFLKPFDEIE